MSFLFSPLFLEHKHEAYIREPFCCRQQRMLCKRGQPRASERERKTIRILFRRSQKCKQTFLLKNQRSVAGKKEQICIRFRPTCHFNETKLFSTGGKCRKQTFLLRTSHDWASRAGRRHAILRPKWWIIFHLTSNDWWSDKVCSLDC